MASSPLYGLVGRNKRSALRRYAVGLRESDIRPASTARRDGFICAACLSTLIGR